MYSSRNAGFFERFYICRDTTGCLNRGFAMCARLNRPVTDALLSNALRSVLLDHPYLCVNAFRGTEGTDLSEAEQAEDAKCNGTNYVVRPVSEILYGDVVSRISVDKIDSSTFEDLARVRIPVNNEKPTWRLQVLADKSTCSDNVLFSCNHVFFDGRSAVTFFEDLVAALAAADGKPEVKVLFNAEADKVGAVPKPAEDIVDMFDTPRLHAAKTIVLAFMPTVVSKVLASYFDWTVPNLFKAPHLGALPFDGYNESKFRLITISPERVKSLVLHCRSVGVTLTPYVAACIYKAIETGLAPEYGKFSQNAEMVIDGRRYYPDLTRKTRYGVFATTITPYVIGDTIDEAAFHLARMLNAGVADRHGFYNCGMLRLINIWGYFKSKVANRQERSTFEVSNVGNVKVQKDGWQVENLLFGQGITGALITLSVVSTAAGMNIMISYHDKLDADAMEVVFAEFEKSLQ